MQIRFNVAFAILILNFAAVPGFAACHAVTPSGAGSKNGSSWSNAYAGIPSTLVRGDRYYLADGSYASIDFTTATSGTSVIEIRKAQSYDYGRSSDGCSNDISAGWNASTMGNVQAVFSTHVQMSFDTSYITVNGNSQQTGAGCGGSPGATMSSPPTNPKDCGIKIDNSGCSGGDDSCYAPISGSAICSCALSGITIEGIEYAGMGNASVENYGMWFRAYGSGSNLSISHVYGHNTGAVYIVVPPGSNFSETHNYWWGLESTLGDDPNHGQFIQTEGAMSGMTDAQNVYRDGAGTAVFSTVGGDAITGWAIYDNVFVYTTGWSPAYPYSDGLISCITQACAILFYQNSEVNVNGSTGVNNEASGGNVTIENNIYYGGSMPAFSGGTITQGHNSFLVSGTSCPSGTANVCANTSGNPFTNWPGQNFTLASDNANWNNRLSLSSPYDTDAPGNAFTTDKGAYQYVSGSSPSPPVGVTGGAVVVQ